MNVLAIDTSTSYLSLAVGKDRKLLQQSNVMLEKVLSSSIIDQIDKILKKAKLKLQDIDGFAVGLGPGSFTSLRIGFATVKAFAFALNKPVVGVSSLDLIALNVPKGQASEICVLSDARRSLVYACLYRREDKREKGLKAITPYLLLPLKEALAHIKTDVIFVGDALPLYQEQIEKLLPRRKVNFAHEKCARPQAKHLLALAFDRFEKNQRDDLRTLSPLYLYPEDCQVDKKTLKLQEAS